MSFFFYLGNESASDMWLAKLAANLSAKEDDLNNDVLDKNNQAYGDDDFQSYGLDPNEGW